VKKFFLAGCIFTVFSCAGMVVIEEAAVDFFKGRDFRDSAPYNESLVFLGVAQYDGYRPDLERNKAIERALDDAARKVALFYSVGGRVAIREKRTGSSFLNYESVIEKEIFEDAEAYKQYRDDLEYDPAFDIFEDENKFGKKALFVRARYRKANLRGISYAKAQADKKPRWIDDPPKIEGYLVGVGFTTYRSNFKETIVYSYETAVDALISAEIQVTASVSDTQLSSGGSTTGSENKQEASGYLDGFYILEIWQDPENSNVYTLAVAKNKKNL
jgi:hypothetical protein